MHLIRGGDKVGGVRGHRAARAVMTRPATVPSLTFVRHENEYKLSAIWESENDGQTLVN